MDRYPTQHENDDDKESVDTATPRRKAFYDSWMRRRQSSERSLFSSAEDDDDDDEDDESSSSKKSEKRESTAKKDTAWTKFGSFLASLGGEREKSDTEVKESIKDQPAAASSEQTTSTEAISDYETTPYEAPEQSPAATEEVSLSIESEAAAEEPTVVYERSSEASDNSKTEKESEDTEPSSVKTSKSATSKTSETSEPERADHPVASAPEVAEAPTLEQAEVASAGREVPFAEREPEAAKPETIETIERRGGLTLPEVYLFRRASNKTRRQGKNIESLRKKSEKQSDRIDALEQQPKLTRSEVEQIVRKPIEVEKRATAPIIERLLKPVTEKQEQRRARAEKRTIEQAASRKARAPVERLLERIERTFEKAPKLKTAKNETLQRHDKTPEAGVEMTKETSAEPKPERIKRVIENHEKKDAPEVIETEDPRELQYERSHEIKQFTATALSDAIDASQAKKLIEKIRASQADHDAKIAAAAIPDPPKQTPAVSPKDYKQAMIAGSTTAIVIMVIIFMMYVLF